MASLKLSGVDKVYPSGTLALYDINIETAEKEFIVIVGGEASGKSTLLRTVAGLEEVSGGQIFVDGKDVTEAEPKDRNVAMVFRNNTLYPALTVFDNMAFGLKMRKAPQALIDQRVNSAANVLGLTDVLYRKPKTLTAAQKQRVAIGRAIAREPKLYLFDEPLSGLDDSLKAELLNVIVNLQARMEGTFLYSTKNVSEAMSLGTRVLVLKNGMVQQFDTPSNLYDYPANAYVAFYLGAPSINFVNNAKIVKEDGRYFAVQGELKLEICENLIKRFENVEEYANGEKAVIIGIRPEDAETCKEGIGAVVEKVENDNSQYYAECAVCGRPLVVKTEEGTAKGDKTNIKINNERLYIFDAETRLTLLARDGGYQNTGFADAGFKPLTFKEEEEIKEKFKPKKHEKKKR